MEIPDQGMVQLQSFKLNTDPAQEQQDDSEPETQPESDQGTPEPRNSPPPLAFIEFRIQELHNRRFILLKMQRFRKKAKRNSGRTTEEMTSEDSDELCELEAIRKELEKLLVKKKELEKQGKSSKLSQQEVCPSLHETPRGGIYLLPHPQLTLEDVTLEQRVKTRSAEERPTGLVVPVDLGQTPAVTQCPTCQEVIFTEARRTVGEAAWMLCCLCSMIGCVAGCCLIPFFTDRPKDVKHQCPKCQAHIHTYQPF